MATKRKLTAKEQIAMGMDRSEIKAPINTWNPGKGALVDSNANIFQIHFDKAIGNPDLKIYNQFCVKKSSYEGHLKVYAKYIDYFIHEYDPENQLITNILKVKFSIDRLKLFNGDNVHALIDLIYELIFIPEMCKKINQMVDDNYLDDIENDSDDTKYATDKRYMESLEFKNEHIKILLRISFGMKIIAPIMYHFFAFNKLKPDTLKSKQNVSIVYDFYFPLFELFSDGVNMFNKLFVYVKRKVVDSMYHNEKIFKQREILGDDPYLLTEKFVKKQLISENIVKYRFNNEWDPKKKKYKENIIGLNKTIIKYQVIYFTKETYAKTLTEMTNTRDSDGLSASDKMEMNMTKIDAGLLDLAEINRITTLDRVHNMIAVPITEEEIAYYREHQRPVDIQINLVRDIYSELFMSYRDLYTLDRREYNELLLLLKKKLLLDAGFRDLHDGATRDVVLPYILTGNISDKVNKRMIRNSKLLAELEENEDYQYLVNDKYKLLEELHPGWVKEQISIFINTQFTYVCYEAPELLGKPIEAPEEQICDEIIFFLKNV